MNIDETVYTGRPQEKRTPREMAVYDALDKLDIAYRRLDHEAAMTMEMCEPISRLLGIHICKNLFLCNRQKTKFYLLTMPEDKPFHTKDITAQLGCSRLSFAPPGKMQELLGTEPGSASVMGLIFDTEQQVQLVMDRDVIAQSSFGCHPCVNTSSLAMKTEDLLQKFLPYTGHEPVFVSL